MGWLWRQLLAWWRPPAPWWKHYPRRGNACLPHAPGPNDHPNPRLQAGAKVRLRGKPKIVRRVLDVEWHSIRREYVYIVETSAGRFRPYWFAAQLELVTTG